MERPIWHRAWDLFGHQRKMDLSPSEEGLESSTTGLAHHPMNRLYAWMVNINATWSLQIQDIQIRFKVEFKPCHLQVSSRAIRNFSNLTFCKAHSGLRQRRFSSHDL